MKKTVHLIVRLTPDQKAAMNMATDRLGYPSVSKFINEAVKANLNDDELSLYEVEAKPISTPRPIRIRAEQPYTPKGNSKFFDPKEPAI